MTLAQKAPDVKRFWGVIMCMFCTQSPWQTNPGAVVALWFSKGRRLIDSLFWGLAKENNI